MVVVVVIAAALNNHKVTGDWLQESCHENKKIINYIIGISLDKKSYFLLRGHWVPYLHYIYYNPPTTPAN